MNEDIDIIFEDSDIIFDDDIKQNKKIIDDKINDDIKQNKKIIDDTINDDIKQNKKIIDDKINDEVDNLKTDITDIMKKEELNRSRILEEALNSISDQSSSINELEKKAKNFDSLKDKLKNLEKEYIDLNSTYIIKNEKIDYLNNELKEAKRVINISEKRISMLKSLLEIIIQEYGYDDICNITRLTKSQLERFLI